MYSSTAPTGCWAARGRVFAWWRMPSFDGWPDRTFLCRRAEGTAITYPAFRGSLLDKIAKAARKSEFRKCRRSSLDVTQMSPR